MDQKIQLGKEIMSTYQESRIQINIFKYEDYQEIKKFDIDVIPKVSSFITFLCNCFTISRIMNESWKMRSRMFF